MAVTCTPNALMALAACYRCQSADLVQAMRLRLLCAIANGETLDTTPTALVAASACFLCLPKHTMDAIEAYLLCAIANGSGVICDPVTLVDRSACLLCLPVDILDGMKTYLLCAAVNSTPNVGCYPAAIAVAARCFICLPSEIRAAIRVTLYCNLANGTTVACDPTSLAALSSGFLFQSLMDLGSMEVSAAAAAATGGTDAVTSGLLYQLAAYWNLNEASGTRVDSLGISNLTDNNTVAQSTGIMGYSASFVEANSNYLTCASNSSLQVGGADFSVAFWYKHTSQVSDRTVIAAKGLLTNLQGGAFPVTTNTEWAFFYETVGELVSFYINGTGFSLDILGLSAQWNLIYGEYEHATGQMRISVNGGAKSTSAGVVVSVANNEELCVGTEPFDHLRFFSGDIDEMGIWKRRLSDSEIDDLYSQGNGNTYPFTGGQFTDESGDFILDENGNIIFGTP